MNANLFSSTVVALFLALISFSAQAYTCGNGVKEVGEVCDHGTGNSDVAANACRTDCRAPYCGDAVIDSGEACDEGQGRNSDTLSNRCRDDCTRPFCGDGVTDNHPNYGGEQCDDGNRNDDDGCLSECKSCLELGALGNIEITADTELCSGAIKLDDYGDYGTIIIKRSGVTLDCNGLELTGEGRGVGVMIFRSNNVTIQNCTIYGYEIGIKGEESNNITLTNNKLCNNALADIELVGATQMSGHNNQCKRPGSWSDTGKQGCSRRLTFCNPPAASMTQQPNSSRALRRTLQKMPHVSVQTKTTATPREPLSSSSVSQQADLPKSAVPKIVAPPPKSYTQPKVLTPAK